MSALARDAGLNRGNLYKALPEDSDPTLATLLKVTCALRLRLRLEPVEHPAQGVPLTKHQDLPAGVTSM